MHLVSYFEGIASERGLEWRSSDSLSLRDFLVLASGCPTILRVMGVVPPTDWAGPRALLERTFVLSACRAGTAVHPVQTDVV